MVANSRFNFETKACDVASKQTKKKGGEFNAWGLHNFLLKFGLVAKPRNIRFSSQDTFVQVGFLSLFGQILM